MALKTEDTEMYPIVVSQTVVGQFTPSKW